MMYPGSGSDINIIAYLRVPQHAECTILGCSACEFAYENHVEARRVREVE